MSKQANGESLKAIKEFFFINSHMFKEKSDFGFDHDGYKELCLKGIEEILNRDNPVASIPREAVEKFCKSNMCHNRDRYLSAHAFVTWYNEEYARESDKEQPKCECNHYSFYTKSFCTDCNNEKVFPDEEKLEKCPKCKEGYMLGSEGSEWCQNHCE